MLLGQNVQGRQKMKDNKDQMKKLLGKRIKEIRNKRGITQERLAELVNIGTPNISYIENGKFYPSYETFIGLLQALNVEPCELFTFDMAKSADELKQEMMEAFNNDEKLLRLVYKLYRAIAV